MFSAAVPAQVCLRLLTKITKGNSTKFRSVSCGTIATENEVAIYTNGTVQTELFRLAQASEVAVQDFPDLAAVGPSACLPDSLKC